MAHIAIIGAGTSGLACALAIANSGGHQISVFEAQAQPPATATCIHLPPNASRVLRALGIGQQLDNIAAQPAGVQTNTARLGFELSRLPLGDFVHERYGAPYYQISHQALLGLLLESAARQADIRIHREHKCTHIEAGVCHFANGAQSHADLIVRAHGADSNLASQAAITDRAYAYHLWSGPSAGNLEAIVHWLGHETLVTQSPLPTTEQPAHWVQCVVRRPREEPQGQTNPGPPCFATNPTIEALLGNVCYSRLCDQMPNPVWQEGSWVLLGGAAQAIGPHLVYGEAVALEEAWVLGRFLEQLEQAPTKAAAEYVRYRARRRQAVEHAQQQHLAQQIAHRRWDKATRNLKLTLGSRFLPELAMSRLDWLYGYDCVRGFH